MIINSILQTDLYKFSMQQVACFLFPRARAQYRFINRGGTQFPKDFDKYLRAEIQKMSELRLTEKEYAFLKTIRFLNPVYLDFLRGYRFNPDEVQVKQEGGDLQISIEGPWYSTILWEVPLMAAISELYFVINAPGENNLAAAYHKTLEKAKFFKENKIYFAEFGTRRRHSFSHHYETVDALSYTAEKYLVGTSNVFLAMRFHLKPISTVAHEHTMFHAAKYGFMSANKMALENWVKVYQGDLGIALTDTFKSKDFFRVFNLKFAKLFDGVRHDSGNPFEFADQVIAHYDNLGIDPKTKTIVFSDGLNPEKVEKIEKYCGKLIKTSYGIGTNLTNDIEGITPLNMVIKMTAADPCGTGNWCETVKLSDDEGKEVGSPLMVDACKTLLSLWR